MLLLKCGISSNDVRKKKLLKQLCIIESIVKLKSRDELKKFEADKEFDAFKQDKSKDL